MFKTKIKYKQELLDKILQVMATLFEKDPTFKYKVTKNGEFTEIYIISDEKDKAHQRGLWFYHKVEGVEGYEVTNE